MKTGTGTQEMVEGPEAFETFRNAMKAILTVHSPKRKAGQSRDNLREAMPTMEQAYRPNNWVERRAHREKILATQSEELWNPFRSAIQDACVSFQRLYPQPHAICALENGKRIRITRTIPADGTRMHPHNLTVLIGFQPDNGTI